MGDFARAYVDILKWIGGWIGTLLFALLISGVVVVPIMAYQFYTTGEIPIPFDVGIVLLGAIVLTWLCVTVVPFVAWLMTAGIDDSGEYPACPECGSNFAVYPDKYVCPNDDCDNERNLIFR